MYISAIDVRMRLKDSVSAPKALFMVRDPEDPSGMYTLYKIILFCLILVLQVVII